MIAGYIYKDDMMTEKMYHGRMNHLKRLLAKDRKR